MHTDSLLREVGLHLAVATMRRGERCRLHVAPQYAFGERGSFSFPSVPPSADVEYEVPRLIPVVHRSHIDSMCLCWFASLQSRMLTDDKLQGSVWQLDCLSC